MQEKIQDKRPALKTHPRFNNYPFWKDKLRENCCKRVREDRTSLLWKLRMPAAQAVNDKEFIKSAFQDIVSDELKKIKDSSISDCLDIPTSDPKSDDLLWEYNGLQDAYEGDCEEMLLEMQRIFYEDLRAESTRTEPECQIDTWEDQEDEYLAHAVFEHMQLNDEQGKTKMEGKISLKFSRAEGMHLDKKYFSVPKQIWCPVCKEGALQENDQHIYCTLCKFQLDRDNEVNLDFLRDRLAEAHADHFVRGCRVKPKFFLESHFGLTALYIRCQACNTFEVVI